MFIYLFIYFFCLIKVKKEDSVIKKNFWSPQPFPLITTEQPRKQLRAKFLLVQSHDILPMSFVDFDCSNTKPVLFWTSCLACFQVIPCADRAVVRDVGALIYCHGICVQTFWRMTVFCTLRPSQMRHLLIKNNEPKTLNSEAINLLLASYNKELFARKILDCWPRVKFKKGGSVSNILCIIKSNKEQNKKYLTKRSLKFFFSSSLSVLQTVFLLFFFIVFLP